MDCTEVTCPTCFEPFFIPVPPPSETPAELDYDCEICCRPMVIEIRNEDGIVVASARGIHD
jgi:hypothetical protein